MLGSSEERFENLPRARILNRFQKDVSLLSLTDSWMVLVWWLFTVSKQGQFTASSDYSDPDKDFPVLSVLRAVPRVGGARSAETAHTALTFSNRVQVSKHRGLFLTPEEMSSFYLLQKQV